MFRTEAPMRVDNAFVVDPPQQNICPDVTDNTQQLLWLLKLQYSTAQLLQHGTLVELDTQHQLNVRRGGLTNPLACSWSSTGQAATVTGWPNGIASTVTTLCSASRAS